MGHNLTGSTSAITGQFTRELISLGRYVEIYVSAPCPVRLVSVGLICLSASCPVCLLSCRPRVQSASCQSASWLVWFGLVYWGLTPPQQPGSYQGGEMMMMKSVFWWRKPEYPEETTDLQQPRVLSNKIPG